MAQQPLLRELIDIRESISTSDFVLELAKAVTDEGHRAQALRDYVVTDRLAGNFDEALSLIKSALDGNTSKPAYLHGSFGAGKSHFMAVLYALVHGDTAARSRTEFDQLLTKHSWLLDGDKKFLMVPYHMIGAKTMEQRVLGGYVDHVQRLHPEASVPLVYRTDALFTSLRHLRETMGESAFLAALNRNSAGGEEDEWGDSDSPAFWTTDNLDLALSAAEYYDDGREDRSAPKPNLVEPAAPQDFRGKLVNDATITLLPGFIRDAAENEQGFVSLDAGLGVISQHAKSLGYDGLILFLDELILWLAGLIHDQKFVSNEAGKITNLKEGGDTRRAIPIVSFIARQRDLRELVGEELSGAAETSIQDTLNLASGRFDVIRLEDRNLPEIARTRLLRPRGDEAAAQIDAAFERTKKLGPQVWDTLLGSDKGTTGADESSFRLSYPFSPAFLDTLVHISAALQRSRTGLKIMGQLLADHRDDLRLGDLVPVGDLYEQLARGGDRPFTADKKVLFDAADKLYRTRLRPYLLDSQELTEDDIRAYRTGRAHADAQTAGRCRQFIGQNRLICTILLAALAPTVPALRELTIRRLAALNHGSVVTPIPGAEVGIIQGRVEEWAGRFPEIKKVGTETNPAVRLELSGVDVDSVIANAQVNDNANNRASLAKQLLIEELGITEVGGHAGDELRFTWRGSERVAEVIFGNVSDEDTLPDHDLQPTIEGRWRIVIDLPYDEGPRTPIEDANRMRALRERQQDNPARAVAWLPTHLSKKRRADFGRLVVIDKALADEHRFDTQYAQHLNADNRAAAKQLLQSQRETLRGQLKAVFKQAYGLAEKIDVTTEIEQHFHPLPEVADLTLPIGQSMREGIRDIAGKLMAHQFPDHPDLDPDRTGAGVRAADTKTVLTHIRSAAESRDGRVEVPAKDRALMRRLAQPLGLGQQKEAYFELSRRWVEHFKQSAQTHGSTGDLTVISLGDWTDLPNPRGLEPHVKNLVIAAFAEMDDRVWVRGGSPLPDSPELHQIRTATDALRTQPLPEESVWETARQRFEVLFGAKTPTLRRGRLVHQLARQITEAAGRHRDPALRLVEQLEKHAEFLGLDDTDATGRLALARRSTELLQAVAGGAGGAAAAKKTIETFAAVELPAVSVDRYGTSLATADAVAAALAQASWDTLKMGEYLGPEGAALLDSLRNTARTDQRTADLVAALRSVTTQITELAAVRARAAARAEPPAAAPAPPVPRATDIALDTDTSHPQVPAADTGAPAAAPRRSGSHRGTARTAAAELSAELAALEPGATIEISWRVVE
ncbi:BREX-2 system ATPase PglY [Nocardia sp. NBC_01329]|uniref:BREX-2 system ATPase PglY n=1 Tax=Nocardia sp. NBC_01329 TaxID=2903594 RepID=UPI002E12D459|nr:phage resistance protein [Nocardia sp. NBC_01329]